MWKTNAFESSAVPTGPSAVCLCAQVLFAISLITSGVERGEVAEEKESLLGRGGGVAVLLFGLAEK